MNNSWNIVAIIGSVIIPLVVFMFALRPWVRDTARDAVSNIGIELASLRAELKAYREAQKEYIEIYKLIANPRNPHPGKEVLLEKLKNDTLTREEAIALQQIMNEERQRAEEQNDFLKAIVIIGILAAVAIPKYMALKTDAEQAAEDGTVGGVRGGISIWHANALVNDSGTWPEELDYCGDVTAGPSNKFFESVLDTPITDSRWSKADTDPPVYTGPNDGLYTYTSSDGSFE